MVHTRIRALALIALAATAIAPTVRAEAPLQPRPRLHCEAVPSVQSLIDQCYAAGGDDDAKLARCDEMAPAVMFKSPASPDKGRTLLCRPAPAAPLEPTARQIDLCYAWAGDDEVKLEACDELANQMRSAIQRLG